MYLFLTLKNKIYNSIYELAQDINGNILQNSNKIIKIEWFWEYDNLDDESDTKDGMFSENYNFLVRMIGTENK